jgi:hypothetical protein
MLEDLYSMRTGDTFSNRPWLMTLQESEIGLWSRQWDYVYRYVRCTLAIQPSAVNACIVGEFSSYLLDCSEFGEPAPVNALNKFSGIESMSIQVYLDLTSLVYRDHRYRSFSSMSVLACPLSRASGVDTRLFVDLEPVEGLKKEGVDDARSFVDLELLADLKKPPKPPRLDTAF